MAKNKKNHEQNGYLKGTGILKYLSSLQALSVFILMFSIMSLTLPNFLSVINMTNLSKQLAISLIMGIVMTMVIIAGEIDLSIGSVVCLCGIISGTVIKQTESIYLGVLASVVTGLVIGYINGALVSYGKMPSFIVTLGTMMMARSLAFVVSDGRVLSFPGEYRTIGQGDIFGIPNLLIIVVLAYTIAFIIMRSTRFGHYIYAVGSNKTAAILSGIDADKIKLLTMTISGFVAGFCGVLLTSRVMAIQADAARGLEFEVIAGVIIGGTSFKGGQGNVLQTIIGIIIIGMIRNGLNMIHINIFWNDFVTGLIILIAVLLDTSRKELQRKLKEKALTN
jgi:ribose/xylose/arabinose/galactoside ABC-type transport system permease subunit